jgi:hypothetical protein
MTGEFEIKGSIEHVQVIAVGRRIRVLPRLRKAYGPGRWRKLKGVAVVRLSNGILRRAEIHWYEMNIVGRKEMRIKRYLP